MIVAALPSDLAALSPGTDARLSDLLAFPLESGGGIERSALQGRLPGNLQLFRGGLLVHSPVIPIEIPGAGMARRPSEVAS